MSKESYFIRACLTKEDVYKARSEYLQRIKLRMTPKACVFQGEKKQLGQKRGEDECSRAVY